MSSLTLSKSKIGYRRNSKSSMADARLIGIGIEDEDEMKGRNIQLGFAGEFFVHPTFVAYLTYKYSRC